MIRLGALILATLAGLFLVLSVWGEGDPRAERRAALRQQAAAPAAEPAADPAAAVPQPQIIPALVEAQSQTPRQVQRFPGPALRPSPEHAQQRPAAASLPDGPVLYVTADRVNMRAGPSTGDRVVTSLARGTAVQPLGPTGGEWVNIRDADGRLGYVAGRFLSPEAP